MTFEYRSGEGEGESCVNPWEKMALGRGSILGDPLCVKENTKDGNWNFRNELMSQRKQ